MHTDNGISATTKKKMYKYKATNSKLNFEYNEATFIKVKFCNHKMHRKMLLIRRHTE